MRVCKGRFRVDGAIRGGMNLWRVGVVLSSSGLLSWWWWLVMASLLVVLDALEMWVEGQVRREERVRGMPYRGFGGDDLGEERDEENESSSS